MLLGGVSTIESIQDRPGQVHSHDFVGCIQSVSVNGRSLNLSNPLKSRGVTSTCHRRREICDMHAASCGEGGICLDGWSNATCVCQGGLEAPNCFSALEPMSFTEGSYAEFFISERHRRRQILRTLYSNGQRWKRETRVNNQLDGRFNRHTRQIGESISLHNSVSISFRTVSKYGYLLFAATNNDFTTLRVSRDLLLFLIIVMTKFLFWTVIVARRSFAIRFQIRIGSTCQHDSRRSNGSRWNVA